MWRRAVLICTLMVQAVRGITNVLHRSHIRVDFAISWVAAGITAIHRAVHLGIFATTLMVLPGTLWRPDVTLSQTLQKFCHELPLGHLWALLEVWCGCIVFGVREALHVQARQPSKTTFPGHTRPMVRSFTLSLRHQGLPISRSLFNHPHFCSPSFIQMFTKYIMLLSAARDLVIRPSLLHYKPVM